DGIVGCISLDCELGTRHKVGQDRSSGESLFELLKGGATLGSETPRGVLLGEAVIVNELAVEVGEAKERLDVFHLLGFRPVTHGLDFILGHG
ncbi:hypothetical protein PISMIDRAFT_95626, partial [Pisolithus microcarpus 441]